MCMFWDDWIRVVTAWLHWVDDAVYHYRNYTHNLFPISFLNAVSSLSWAAHAPLQWLKWQKRTHELKNDENKWWAAAMNMNTEAWACTNDDDTQCTHAQIAKRTDQTERTESVSHRIICFYILFYSTVLSLPFIFASAQFVSVSYWYRNWQLNSTYSTGKQYRYVLQLIYGTAQQIDGKYIWLQKCVYHCATINAKIFWYEV